MWHFVCPQVKTSIHKMASWPADVGGLYHEVQCDSIVQCNVRVLCGAMCGSKVIDWYFSLYTFATFFSAFINCHNIWKAQMHCLFVCLLPECILHSISCPELSWSSINKIDHVVGRKYLYIYIQNKVHICTLFWRKEICIGCVGFWFNCSLCVVFISKCVSALCQETFVCMALSLNCIRRQSENLP